jgi:hypothetical protein
MTTAPQAVMDRYTAEALPVPARNRRVTADWAEDHAGPVGSPPARLIRSATADGDRDILHLPS